MGEGGRANAHFSKDDITVHRTLTTDRFEHVAVAFTIESDREHPTRIRLFDDIPPAVGIENIGFHPEYEGDRWYIADGQVFFDHWVKPDAAIHTMYAVLDVDEQQAKAHLTEPTLDLVLVESKTAGAIPHPDRHTRPRQSDAVELDIDEASPAEPSAPATAPTSVEDGAFITVLGRMLGSTSAGPSTTSPSQTSKAITMADSEQPSTQSEDSTGTDTSDANEDTPSSQPTAGRAADGRTPESDDADAEVVTMDDGGQKQVSAGNIASVLAEEFRNDAVSEDDREFLREWAAESHAHNDVRVQHLQQRISDLEAYTDSLESFINENGTGRKLINDLKASMESLETEIEDYEERIDTTGEDLSELEDGLTDLSEDLTSIGEDVEALSADLSDLDAEVDEIGDEMERLDDLEEQTASIRDDLEGIHDHLESLDSFRDRLLSVLESETRE